jgi:hypothetical protein
MSNKILWPCQNILTLIIKEIFNPPLSPFFFFLSLKYCFLKLKELIQEAEKYTKDRRAALDVGQNLGHLYYPLETCRKEISCYKLMYNKIGKRHPIQPLFMFKILNRLITFRKSFFVHIPFYGRIFQSSI